MTRFIFGDFELDESLQELRRQGNRVELRPTPYRLLLYLVWHRDRTVSKNELLDEVWGEVSVSEATLASTLSAVRLALGDDAATHRWIETRRGQGYRFVGDVDEHPRNAELAAAGPIRSLAVLPLGNLSGDPDQDYLADGMTEALIVALGKIDSLRVISRTSVLRYQQSDNSIKEIAAALNVEAVIEGTVTRVADRVRVTVQLIDAAQDCHLWAESFERELSNAIALQSQIALAVARELRLRLPEVSRARLADAPRIVPKALEAYFRAFRFGGSWDPFVDARYNQNFEEMIRELETAIGIDPTFTDAHIQLACTYIMATAIWMYSPRTAMERARSLCDRARTLDPMDGRAPAVLGWVQFHYDWDWDEAEVSLEEAVLLSPHDAIVRFTNAQRLATLGRDLQALAEMRRALAADPKTPSLRFLYCQMLSWAGYPTDAEREAEVLVREFPRSFASYINLAHLLENEDVRRMIDLQVEALRIMAFPEAAIDLAALEARSECSMEPIFRLELDVRRSQMASLPEELHYNFMLANLHAKLGEIDEAFAFYERALEQRDYRMPYLRKVPPSGLLGVPDSVRRDPRFEQLAERVGIPES